MAIVQISRITNRKGHQENLPQLAGAEFGWAIDSRRLFIGNGTLQEGAPVIGNTEILTEYSDITVLSDYTYEDIVVGYAPQTGPTANQPVVRSVQARLDDSVSVRAFGAVGDGETDDTAAINRALFQLYCRDINTQTRRSLFFPAGTYRITDTLLIPSYAKLVGEGADSSIIVLDTQGDSSVPDYVARTGDSLQQIGSAIGSNGAVPPRDIEISCMTFRTVENTDVFFVQAAQQCWFNRVYFQGPVTEDDLLDTSFSPVVTNVAGVRFASLPQDTVDPGTPCQDIVLDSCGFLNLTFAINTDQFVRAVTVTNSQMDTLYQGVVLDQLATAFRVVHNSFDRIFAQGIVYNDVSLNVSAYNVFFNVGQNIGSSGATTAVITFGNDNNVSVGDMFQRSILETVSVPSIEITGTSALVGSTQMRLGRYARQNGISQALVAGTVADTVTTINAQDIPAFGIDYRISRSVGGTQTVRRGTLSVIRGPADDSSDDLAWSDDYTENFDTGVTLEATQTGDIITVTYAATAGNDGVMQYSVKYLA